MNKEIIYFYKLNQNYYYIGETNDELKIMSAEKMRKFDCIRYEANGEYEATQQSLIQFRKDFNIWAEELMNNKQMKIFYKKHFTHNDATMRTFKRCTAQLSINFQPILYKEFYYLENCNNGGLIIFDNQYKNKTIQTYGYDFSAFYPNLLSNTDLKIPINQGKRKKIKSLKNLRYGIYRCIIKCSHPEFQKVFMFSKLNLYTHYSIDFALRHKELYNITVEIIIDDDYNVMLWDESDLIDTTTIFSNWFNNLSAIKKQYPKNYLVKHMMSYLWGYLISYKKEYYNTEEFNELDVSYMDDDDFTEYKLYDEKYYKDDTSPTGINTTYEVIKSSNPYKYPYARLKPFLVSYARAWIGDLLITENLINDVIRLQTDGICLNKPHDFTHLEYYPKPENKTTGLILWTHVNEYEKV